MTSCFEKVFQLNQLIQFTFLKVESLSIFDLITLKLLVRAMAQRGIPILISPGMLKLQGLILI